MTLILTLLTAGFMISPCQGDTVYEASDREQAAVIHAFLKAKEPGAVVHREMQGVSEFIELDMVRELAGKVEAFAFSGSGTTRAAAAGFSARSSRSALRVASQVSPAGPCSWRHFSSKSLTSWSRPWAANAKASTS